MSFIESELLCQKVWAFLSNVGSFYDVRSPNMVMSRDPRSKFRKFLFCPNSTFNIRKSHKISSLKALDFRSYQQKTFRGGWGGGNTSVPLGLEYQEKEKEKDYHSIVSYQFWTAKLVS